MTGWSRGYADGWKAIRWTPTMKGKRMPKGNPAGYGKGKPNPKGKGKMSDPAKNGAPMAKAAAMAAKSKKG